MRSGRQWLILLPAATAVLIGAFCLWLGKYTVTVPEWRILVDDDGRIAHVACVVNSARRAALRNAALVTRIVNALPRRTRVTVLTNDPRAFAIIGDPQRGRLEFFILPGKSDFTIWPQDPFVVLVARDGRRVLLASREFDRADDRLIPQRLAGHLHIPYRRSKLSFEGGNIVAGSRHVFIGANTIRYNAIRLHKTDPDIVRAFQREFGRPVLVIGPVPQPVDHIDMMLTAAGGDLIGVADPGWGARLVQRELKQNPGRIKAFERCCEEYYFGNPRVRALRDVKGELIKPPNIEGETSAAAEDSERIAPELDRIAVELRRYGYRVRRFPFLMRARKMTPLSSSGKKPPDMQAGYPCLTYNNVLIEDDSAHRIVYLPQYGLAALDRAASDAWRRLGWRVVPVQGFAISAMYGGSLRCCAKVLERQ
ncbi:MAG: hypothetical protein ACP5R5_07275 [Armatimonadota bacterium]